MAGQRNRSVSGPGARGTVPLAEYCSIKTVASVARQSSVIDHRCGSARRDLLGVTRAQRHSAHCRQTQPLQRSDRTRQFAPNLHGAGCTAHLLHSLHILVDRKYSLAAFATLGVSRPPLFHRSFRLITPSFHCFHLTYRKGFNR